MTSNAASSDNMTRPTSSKRGYYDLLNVSPTATPEEIKRSYRQLALRLHPDKNPDPEATAQFQAIDKAYKVLSDPKLRSTYDRFGSSGESTEIEVEQAPGIMS